MTMNKGKDNLGDRMKGYENAYRIKFPQRLPVLLRIDGKAFHTFTKGMEKPFDEGLTNACGKQRNSYAKTFKVRKWAIRKAMRLRFY